MSELREIQEKHKQWVASNFGPPILDDGIILQFRALLFRIGRVSKYLLKSDQGIRGTLAHHMTAAQHNAKESVSIIVELICMMANRETTQKNGDLKMRRETQCLLGIVEETVEFMMAMNDDERRKELGDVCMFILDLANVHGFDLADVIAERAASVHRRNWIANPTTGDVTP